MSIGIFMLVKNEARWVGPWLMHLLPHVDQFAIFDGNSTDGTLEILEHIQRLPGGKKICLFKDRDPKDLRDDYVRHFNEALHSLVTDWALFLHPDMWVTNPKEILKIKDSPGVAMYTRMESYGGEPGSPPMRIVEGRGEIWKNIYRLNSPDLGAHYHGWYGAANEDVYLRAITGDSHEHYGSEVEKYPYPVRDSGLKILHFSDVRTGERRLSRMRTCLINQGYPEEAADRLSREHPRVTLLNGKFGAMNFRFLQSDYPEEMKKHQAYFEKFLQEQMVNA